MPRPSKTGVRGLYQDPDGRYRIDLRWIDVRTGQPRRHKERLPDGVKALVAKRRALDLLSAIMAGTYVAPEEARAEERIASEGKLGAAFERYLEHLAARGLRTADDRRAHAARFVAVLGADRALASLVALDVERVRKALRDEGASEATCNRYLATFRHFARWAEELDGTMPIEVAARLRKVRPMREPPGRVRYVREHEEEKLATLGGWLRAIVDAARCSGMRLGELTGMRWAHVHPGERTIELGRTKNGRRRFVPITPALASVLAVLPQGEGSAYVFPVPMREAREDSRRTEDERRRDTVSTAFSDWTREAGLDDLRFHDLRHDFATRVRRAGAGLDVVASLLGHASLQMSARYAHLDDGAIRAAAAAVTLRQPPAIVAPALPPGRRGAGPRTRRGGLENRVGHLGLEPRANGLRVATEGSTADPTNEGRSARSSRKRE